MEPTPPNRVMQNKLMIAIALLAFAYFSATAVRASGALDAASSKSGSVLGSLANEASRKLLDHTNVKSSRLGGLHSFIGRAHSSAKSALAQRRQHRAPSWEEELVLLEGVPQRKLLSAMDMDAGDLYEQRVEKIEDDGVGVLIEAHGNRRRVLQEDPQVEAPRIFRPRATV